jgi:hypothetical protein
VKERNEKLMYNPFCRRGRQGCQICIFSNPKYLFRFILKGLEIENYGIFCGH